VTLLPGNHDAYTSPDAWRLAMEGPLRPFRRSSATERGKVIDLGDAVLLIRSTWRVINRSDVRP
jgi:hypothetical protein